MRAIVEKEKENSRRMIGVCEADVRLGYHSEAEGYKFFPEKLRHRIATLEELLNTEFPEVEARIADGKSPLGFYTGEEAKDAYTMICGSIEDAKFDTVPDTDIKVRLAYDKEDTVIQFVSDPGTVHLLTVEFVLGQPTPAINITDGKMEYPFIVTLHQSIHGDLIDKYRSFYRIECESRDGKVIHTVRMSHKDSNFDPAHPIRVLFGTEGSTWQKSEDLTLRLGKDYCDPSSYKWVRNA
jgi:hypothetical protein